MSSDDTYEERMGEAFSLPDLKEIKEAVIELRASDPRNLLADLSAEKIRAIECAIHSSARIGETRPIRNIPRDSFEPAPAPARSGPAA